MRCRNSGSGHGNRGTPPAARIVRNSSGCGNSSTEAGQVVVSLPVVRQPAPDTGQHPIANTSRRAVRKTGIVGVENSRMTIRPPGPQRPATARASPRLEVPEVADAEGHGRHIDRSGRRRQPSRRRPLSSDRSRSVQSPRGDLAARHGEHLLREVDALAPGHSGDAARHHRSPDRPCRWPRRASRRGRGRAARSRTTRRRQMRSTFIESVWFRQVVDAVRCGRTSPAPPPFYSVRYRTVS